MALKHYTLGGISYFSGILFTFKNDDNPFSQFAYLYFLFFSLKTFGVMSYHYIYNHIGVLGIKYECIDGLTFFRYLIDGGQNGWNLLKNVLMCLEYAVIDVEIS